MDFIINNYPTIKGFIKRNTEQNSSFYQENKD